MKVSKEKYFTDKLKKQFFKKVYIESYGCQMNFSDSEIVASILSNEGYSTTKDIVEANLVFVNTCSIREKAEQTVRKRLQFYKSIKRKKNPKNDCWCSWMHG